MDNHPATVSDLPERWYTLTTNDKNEFFIDEKTANFIANSSDQVIKIYDEQKRLLRWINKAYIISIDFNKGLTKEKWAKKESDQMLLTK